jgi:hypothetical protein
VTNSFAANDANFAANAQLMAFWGLTYPPKALNFVAVRNWFFEDLPYSPARSVVRSLQILHHWLHIDFDVAQLAGC